MTTLTTANMDGVAGALGQSQPYEWGAGPMPWDGQLTPDYGTDRVLPDIEANEFWMERRVPEGVPLWTADRSWPVKAVTRSNDARDLPRFSNPLLELPIRDFSRNYPHHYTPYENIKSVIGQESPPIIPGYARIPRAANEQARAIAEVLPKPAVAPEAAAYDVSGFATLQQLQQSGLGGLGQDWLTQIGAALGLVQSPEGQAATAAVQQEADAAKAAGASPSTIEKIINFGSEVAALYLQKRQMDQLTKEQERDREAELAALQAKAAASNMPPPVQQYVSKDTSEPPEQPIYKNPYFIGGAVLAVTIAAVVGSRFLK